MLGKDGGIKRLKRRLRSRKDVPEGLERRRLQERPHDIPRDWEAPEQPHVPVVRKKIPLTTFLLMGSIGFFVIAIVFSLVAFFGNTNSVSARNIDIEVSGPVTHPGGEKLPLQISIINRNPLALQNADLIIEYPDGTRSAIDLDIELPRYRESLGTINPGGRVNTTAEAVLFGEESESKSIKLTIEYRTEDSNAIFFKEQDYEILISSAPLTVAVDTFSEVISGQSVTFDVVVKSNAKSELGNVLLEATYPFGFTYTDANPLPALDENIWDLGDMLPGAERRIQIIGTLEGQDLEERTFRFRAGLEKDESKLQLGAAFSLTTATIAITRPFITLNVKVNGQTTPEYTAKTNDRVTIDIDYANNLNTAINNAVISARLVGDAIDQSTVNVQQGFYQSLTDTISWSGATNGELQQLDPGETGSVRATFNILPTAQAVFLRDPSISLEVSIEGQRMSETGVPENTSTIASRTIVVGSDLFLSSKMLRVTGPFTNTGPFPPRAEVESTATVVWTVTNTTNNIANGKVVATVPSYVRWLGRVSPSHEDVTFNASTNTITWDIGNISAGIGSGGTLPREVAFQIAFTPSISHVGTAPVIVNEHVLTGFDRFTESTLQSTHRSIDSRGSNDPGVSGNTSVIP